ncbi:MAG: high frequency lysogenization protein HflD [Pseudomonadota bacterium]
MNQTEERTLALGGIIQACLQVQSLARRGEIDQHDFDTSRKSILVLDAVSTAAVYGGIDGLRTGLAAIAEGLLISPSADDTEVLRYVMSVLHLQRQLVSDEAQFRQFGAEVESLSAFPLEEVNDRCSDLYQKYISVLHPQIIVNGEEEHLQQPQAAATVRTLLLAAIRSAVLWQQKGGGRFNLIWQRSKMRHVARQLLAQGQTH